MDAIIFDMDGLLIDSEPMWRKAEKIEFGRVGITLTDEMCEETVGFRIDEVVKLWHDRFPWKDVTQEEVSERIVGRMEELILTEGKPLPGVLQTLDFFQERSLKIGLASSSHMRLIEAVVQSLGIKDYFHTLHSAEFEAFGKPHPAVFITCAGQLDVLPERCLVFEDSLNGVIAGKAARMKVVAVPETGKKVREGFAVADVLLSSLSEFSEDTWQQLLPS